MKVSASHLIYLIEFIIITFALLVPLAIPLPISKYSKQYYDAVKSVAPNSVVGYDNILFGGGYSLVYSASVRTMAELWDNGAKIVIFETCADSPPMTTLIINEAISIYESRHPGDKIEYDVDYVRLGYIAGEETGFAALMSDIKSLVQVDMFGTPTTQLKMIENVNGGDDMPFMVLSQGSNPAPYVMRQYQTRYGGKLVSIITDTDLPGAIPYLETGQLSGVIVGSTGCAQYEVLTGMPGPNVKQINPLSLTSVLVVMVLIAGNIQYFYEKYRGAQKITEVKK